jgi:hypothetical protein
MAYGEVFAVWEDLCTIIQSKGWALIVSTVWARDKVENLPSNPGNLNTLKIKPLNALISASEVPDYIYDMYEDTADPEDNDNFNSSLFVDYIHPTAGTVKNKWMPKIKSGIDYINNNWVQPEPLTLEFVIAGFASAGTYERTTYIKIFDLRDLNASVFDGSTKLIELNDNKNAILYMLPYNDFAIDDTKPAQQGICFNDSYCFTTGTVRLDKRHRDTYEVISSNDAPFGEIPNIDHLGDCCYLNSKIYVPACKIDGLVYTDFWIMVYDADTLALINDECIDCNAYGNILSGGVGTDGTSLYAIVSRNNQPLYGKVHKLNLSGDLIQTITLSVTDGILFQGIAIHNNEMYVSTFNGGVRVYGLDGTYKRTCTPFMHGDNENEGIAFKDGRMVQNRISVYTPIETKIREFDTLQHLVEGFGVRSDVNPTDVTTTTYIFASYDVDSSQRAWAFRSSNNSISFRTALSGEEINPEPAISYATGLKSVHGWYDSKTRKTYITDGTNSNNKEITKDLYNVLQSIGIGCAAETSPAYLFKGTINFVEGYNIIAGQEVRAYKVLLA